jgi:hypothetical protein
MTRRRVPISRANGNTRVCQLSPYVQRCSTASRRALWERRRIPIRIFECTISRRPASPSNGTPIDFAENVQLYFFFDVK